MPHVSACLSSWWVAGGGLKAAAALVVAAEEEPAVAAEAAVEQSERVARGADVSNLRMSLKTTLASSNRNSYGC